MRIYMFTFVDENAAGRVDPAEIIVFLFEKNWWPLRFSVLFVRERGNMYEYNRIHWKAVGNPVQWNIKNGYTY